MFHEGDLQSGIALAISQAKSVACFVKDDGAESTEWESELQGSEISSLLESKSIVLRLLAGSQEAGFLAAFCPVKEYPSLVIIHNGQLLDFLSKGISKEDFEARIRKALGGESSATSAEAQPTQTPQAVPQQSPPAPTVEDEVPAASAPAATAQILREERAARTSVSKGKQKQVDPPPDPTPTDDTTRASAAARNDWLEQQKQRKSEARKERERVMAQIEADKAERRARREQEKLAREQQAAEVASNPAPSRARRTISKATHSNLQVRLLDGGQIRKQFPAEASLEKEVRAWIDENLDTKAPYTFKQILAPQPARAISMSEEHASLRELDLIPSATLVLQPVQTYSDAYEGGAGGLMALPYNAVTGAYGLVSGTLSGAANWLRGGMFRPEDDDGGRTLADAPQQETRESQSRPNEAPVPRAAPSRGNIRVRTLADQRDGSADQQFYNGNSLDFAPNPDDSSSRKLD